MKARVVRLALPLLVMLAAHNSGLQADPPDKNAPPWKPTVEIARGVSVEERIAMGVDEPTWVKEHGKVHPHVRAALQEQKDLETNMDKDPKANLAATFQPNRPGGFLGYVYVVVHLEHKQQGKAGSAENKAAIKAVQSSVLSKLTAAELSVWLCFPGRPAMLGWVNETGLEKLAKNEKAVAIGLDSKPYPNETPQFYSQGGENTGGGLPKVSAQVRAALEKADYVKVVVNLKHNDIRGSTLLDKDRQARKVQDRVLSRLTAEEFRTTGRSLSGGMSGYVNAAGATKLGEDPDVVGVGLPGPPAKRMGKGERRS